MNRHIVRDSEKADNEPKRQSGPGASNHQNLSVTYRCLVRTCLYHPWLLASRDVDPLWTAGLRKRDKD